MRTTVIRPAELGAAERATWRSFQQAQPELGSPFLAPEITVAAGKVRPGTRVAILEDAGQIIGFFPFERSAFGYGMPVAPGLTDCQGLVHAPDACWDAHDLLRSCGLGVWEFDRLVDGQKPFERYQVVRAPAPVIDLSNGSAAVLADLRRRSSRVAKKLPRLQRRLERDFGPLRFEFETTDPAALRMLMAWKSAQYRRTGRTDRFARPWIRRFVSDLLELRSPHFALVLSVLYAGDQPVAANLELRRDGVMAGWFTGVRPPLRQVLTWVAAPPSSHRGGGRERGPAYRNGPGHLRPQGAVQDPRRNGGGGQGGAPLRWRGALLHRAGSFASPAPNGHGFPGAIPGRRRSVAPVRPPPFRADRPDRAPTTGEPVMTRTRGRCRPPTPFAHPHRYSPIPTDRSQ